jgi:predicted ATP-grasp superfamily ATP-dependent carboligase
MSEPPHPAIVLGLNPNALGTIRSLAPMGVPVIAIDYPPTGPHDQKWMSSRTRLCRKVFLAPPRSEQTLLETLLELGPTLPRPGVILPSGDDQAMCLAGHRALLSRHYLFEVPDRDTMDLINDKARFCSFAREEGFPVPVSYCSVSPSDLDRVAPELHFPCIIKPRIRDEAWERAFGAEKVVRVDSVQALFATYGRLAPDHRLIIQEAIPGPDSELYFSHAYVSRDGELLALWTGRKIRQHPIGFGTSTMAESLHDVEVAAISRRLIEKLRLRGYTSVEFKRDARDGTYRIMELTPARTWYPHYLGTAAGVNIPWIWYNDLSGGPRIRATEFRAGVRWVDEFRDFSVSADYIRAGQLTLREWLRSYRAPLALAHFSLRDPVPALFVIVRVIRGCITASFKAIKARILGCSAPGR